MDDVVVKLGEALLEGDGAALFEEAMGALGGAHHLAGDRHGVGEHDLERCGFQHGDDDVDDVFKFGGFAVAALDAYHGRDDAFGLHAVEAIAELIHPVDSGFLHKTDIVAVVGDAHAVALVIFNFVETQNSRLRHAERF